MPTRVALHHETRYTYDRPIQLQPQTVRLRPAPHCRTPVCSYSLSVNPEQHFVNWMQDPFGNFLARLVFPERTNHFRVTVDLVAEMTVINPFDFFVEDQAEEYPFEYDGELHTDLAPFLRTEVEGVRFAGGDLFDEYLASVDETPRRTVTFLVDLNSRLSRDVEYLVRMEPGVQSPEETLKKGSGSCRDSAWLLVALLRRLGLAARFVSGYLIQLAPDKKPLEGPVGPETDFTDLHAWAEVYLPGAGWVGLDPTSGLFAGEGHLPLAATPAPRSAAPITGSLEEAEVEFDFEMSVTRVHEDPRVTKPYTESEWAKIDRLGAKVDTVLSDEDVRLTMGGEPTFVSIDDPDAPEWTVGAVGEAKRQKSAELALRLLDRFATGGALHYGQGKWYPGESLPRWAHTCFWRADGEPVWSNPDLIARPAYADDASDTPEPATPEDAELFLSGVAASLAVERPHIRPAYEDIYTTLAEERRVPVDVDPAEFDPDSSEDRRRLALILERGLAKPAGYVLPLQKAWWQAKPVWLSGAWPTRSPRLFLIPGDSPIGLRLPLDSLPQSRAIPLTDFAPDSRPPRLPSYRELREAASIAGGPAIAAQIREQSKHERRDSDEEPEPNTGPVINTAMCVEPSDGVLHVFLPPVATLEDYLELVAAVEQTAAEQEVSVILGGYPPPHDSRLRFLKVTPDPGVLEINVPPASDWPELSEIVRSVYEEAEICRLSAEKFEPDGTHTGTGGGNHVVLGSATPLDSPFLRRPDLLKSLLLYWNNHPSLSYLFAGQFIGPTSQAPRVDEGRRDALYELQIAMDQVPAPDSGTTPPWLVDRLFRHLLVDLTGNTHRAEFCIDKLYSPDSQTGRLGLLELRGFEMPPHAQMSLTSQLLVRALVAMHWREPSDAQLARWGTALHDRFMLPHFLSADLTEVIHDLNRAGFEFDADWFAPHLEFRCPLLGVTHAELPGGGQVMLELRRALEPWYVLGEEPAGGGTARYVDSSVERVQVRVRGGSERFTVTCNGYDLPLQEVGAGDAVAGVRFRAWQPPSCLHPTIPTHVPLRFDVIDRANRVSLGGAEYQVEHPGGLNTIVRPINSLEAEARRAARFTERTHTGGRIDVSAPPMSPTFPCTLDLRLSQPLR